jgi:hypothetical protein
MISSVSDVPHRMSKYLSDLAENIAQPNRYANPFIFIVPSADVSAVVPPARQCGIRRADPSAREASCHLWPNPPKRNFPSAPSSYIKWLTRPAPLIPPLRKSLSSPD